MTAKDYFASDTESGREFRAFLDIWVKERYCPVPFVDWLLEHDLESQADFAKWCLKQPNRQMFENGEQKSPPFPHYDEDYKGWWWYPNIKLSDENDVPKDNLIKDEMYWYGNYQTAQEAFVGIMDGWIPSPEDAMIGKS